MSIKEQWWAQTRTATCAAGLPLPGPPSGLRNTSTTESPRKNILLMNRSLLTGLPLDFFGISVHISGSRETKITKKKKKKKKKFDTKKKNNKFGWKKIIPNNEWTNRTNKSIQISENKERDCFYANR